MCIKFYSNSYNFYSINELKAFSILLTDVTPPTLHCPNDFSVPMKEDQNYAVVRIFPAPNVTG